MADDNTSDNLKLKLFGPVAESAGSTLQNLWELVFGSFDLFVQKKKFTRQQDFQDFKLNFENRISNIPADSLKEPKISILGPVLDASKFYFEEKPLRDMFAALAAASVDVRKERYMHPSFPDIIKQMSPLDAENLKLFCTQLPVAEYYKGKKGSNVRQTIISNVFISNKNVSDIELQSQSISSLSRLGLLDVEYEKTVLEDKFYWKFYGTAYFIALTHQLNDEGFLTGVTKGRARLTPLGKSFTSVCF